MWFFAPPSAWTRLPCRVPGLVDVPGDRRGADEAHGRDVRVLEDPVDRDLVALDDVEHAVRDAGLLEQLGQVDRGRGVLLRGLEDERVPARDRVPEHPHRDHRREVERGDPGDDAERLADQVDVDAAGGLLGVAALHEVRRRRVANSRFSRPRATSPRASDGHLAVLRGEVGRDLVAMLLHEVPDPEHDLGALRERRRAPGRERRPRRRDRRVDLLDGGEGDLPRDRAGGRVEHRPACARTCPRRARHRSSAGRSRRRAPTPGPRARRAGSWPGYLEWAAVAAQDTALRARPRGRWGPAGRCSARPRAPPAPPWAAAAGSWRPGGTVFGSAAGATGVPVPAVLAGAGDGVPEAGGWQPANTSDGEERREGQGARDVP